MEPFVVRWPPPEDRSARMKMPPLTRTSVEPFFVGSHTCRGAAATLVDDGMLPSDGKPGLPMNFAKNTCEAGVCGSGCSCASSANVAHREYGSLATCPG